MYLWGQNANSVGDDVNSVENASGVLKHDACNAYVLVKLVEMFQYGGCCVALSLKGYQSLSNCFMILFEISHNNFVNKHRAERASHLLLVTINLFL